MTLAEETTNSRLKRHYIELAESYLKLALAELQMWDEPDTTPGTH